MDAAQRCGAAALGEDVNAHGAAAAERSATEAAAAGLSGARAQGCYAAPTHSLPSLPRLVMALSHLLVGLCILSPFSSRKCKEFLLDDIAPKGEAVAWKEKKLL